MIGAITGVNIRKMLPQGREHEDYSAKLRS